MMLGGKKGVGTPNSANLPCPCPLSVVSKNPFYVGEKAWGSQVGERGKAHTHTNNPRNFILDMWSFKANLEDGVGCL